MASTPSSQTPRPIIGGSRRRQNRDHSCWWESPMSGVNTCRVINGQCCITGSLTASSAMKLFIQERAETSSSSFQLSIISWLIGCPVLHFTCLISSCEPFPFLLSPLPTPSLGRRSEDWRRPLDPRRINKPPPFRFLLFSLLDKLVG